jgi:hypothetical protein
LCLLPFLVQCPTGCLSGVAWLCRGCRTLYVELYLCVKKDMEYYYQCTEMNIYQTEKNRTKCKLFISHHSHSCLMYILFLNIILLRLKLLISMKEMSKAIDIMNRRSSIRCILCIVYMWLLKLKQTS